MKIKAIVFAILLCLSWIGCTAITTVDSSALPTIEPTATEPVPTVTEPSLEEILLAYLQPMEYKTPANKTEAELGANNASEYLGQLTALLPSEADASYELYWNILGEEITRIRVMLNNYERDWHIFDTEEKTEALWVARAEKYPVATKVWLYLKTEMGLNDYVCAGIMGNMMAECGGLTLNLQWDAVGYYKGETYYGLCQWSSGYNIYGQGVDEQLDLLNRSLTVTMTANTHQWARDKYAKGFTGDDFYSMEDAGEAAIAFAQVYERCAAQYVEMRRGLAEQAYQYFVLQDQA